MSIFLETVNSVKTHSIVHRICIMFIDCFVSYQINFVCNIIQDVKYIVEMSGTGHTVLHGSESDSISFL